MSDQKSTIGSSDSIPAIEDFGMLSEADLELAVAHYSCEEISRALKDDPWLCNYAVNIWEYVHGATTLTTYPWNVCLPIADICNAGCTFCNSWLNGKRWLELEDLERFAPVVRHAKLLGLAGHGEPLIHPQIEKITQRFAELIDDRCAVYLITNGHHLPKHLERLRRMNVVTYNISLNAATAETHNDVMGMGLDSWSNVMQGIESLLHLRDQEGENIQVNLSFVVIQQNVHEVARFVELGNRLGVDHLYLRTLMPMDRVDGPPGLNYHTLPPYLHPEFKQHFEEAKAAVARSQVSIEGNPESWKTAVYRPEHAELIRQTTPKFLSRAEAKSDEDVQDFYQKKWEMSEKLSRTSGRLLPILEQPTAAEAEGTDNPYDREPRFSCKFVYHNLNLNNFMFGLYPCCYMIDVPGFETVFYDGVDDFFASWNSPAFVELRRRLVEGPLFHHCKRCPPQ